MNDRHRLIILTVLMVLLISAITGLLLPLGVDRSTARQKSAAISLPAFLKPSTENSPSATPFRAVTAIPPAGPVDEASATSTPSAGTSQILEATATPQPDMLSRITNVILQLFDKPIGMSAPEPTAVLAIAKGSTSELAASPQPSTTAATREQPTTTATRMPPTATATTIPPTATTTREPTATPKPATATTTREPTAAPKPATATATREPTATPKPATATATREPTATPKPATATATREPTATPKPATATPKPAVRATVTPRPSRTPIRPIVSAPVLTEPPGDAATSGNVLFRWQPTGPLPPGTAYEIVAWGRSELPAGAVGIAAPTLETSLAVNLDMVYPGLLTTSEINWTVLVVQTQPYERLTQPGSSNWHTLNFNLPSGSAPPPETEGLVLGAFLRDTTHHRGATLDVECGLSRSLPWRRYRFGGS